MSVRVYAGISLDRDAVARALPGAILENPIRRDDIYRDYDRGTRCFVIVDGEFDQSWAVTAGEILDVIRGGSVVFGSSSMGALRAAEMERFGMIGVGKIFELVRRSPLFMDDWLGHLFDPMTLTPITLPFIEVLFALERDLPHPLERAGKKLVHRHDLRFDMLDRTACHALVDKLRLRRSAGAKRDLDRLFARQSPSQKRKDALALLSTVARHLARVNQLNRRLRAARPRQRYTQT
ncbi:MAG TPA: TfuA-like protein [Kofleriaceae bacterium]|nr:TfuA-like protein [Kofleriaceae bacterium]